MEGRNMWKWLKKLKKTSGAAGFGIRMLGQFYAVLAAGTLAMFVTIGVGAMLQAKMNSSPMASMKGLTSSVSSAFFTDMMAMELPLLRQEGESSTFSPKNIFLSLFQFVTDLNPQDPVTLLAREVPGFGTEQAVLLRKGTGTQVAASPVDFTPSQDALRPTPPQEEGEKQGLEDGERRADESHAAGASRQENSASAADKNGSRETTERDKGGANAGAASARQVSADPIGKKKVFIYHSHNRESWVPELKDKGVTSLDDAFDAKINVTLLGKRMVKRLEEMGIGAVSSEKDYATAVKDYNYNFSYKYSLKTVQEAFATHPDLEYFFDIHRDSQKRELTTATIGGQTYAQIYFIIGHKNPNWRENEALASRIHQALEKKYPGLSRGVWSKTSSSGHAEYNQSFSPNSLLIEVGGPENTLAESYRTIDILSEIIAEIFHDAVKVDAPETSGQQEA
jgi:stage II sporulation protein P